jgi:hypothetical protein
MDEQKSALNPALLCRAQGADARGKKLIPERRDLSEARR